MRWKVTMAGDVKEKEWVVSMEPGWPFMEKMDILKKTPTLRDDGIM